LLRHLFSGQAHAVGDAVVLHIVGVGEDGRRQAGRIAHHGHHAHALHAGRDHHLGLAHADAVRRHLHRRQAGGAETVHRDPAHRVRQTGQDGADTRHIQALLRLGDRAAADHVFNGFRVEPWRLGQRRAQDGSEQVVGAGVAEIALVRAPDRRARGGNDVGFLDLFAHGFFLLRQWISACAGRTESRPR
jgi:hypothetical protein